MSEKELLLKIRRETGLGIMDIKRALAESGGDEAAALAILAKKGAAVMAKRQEKTASQGVIDAYIHNGRLGVLLEVNCETDFVARNPDFLAFVHDLSLQISSMNPADVTELLEQDFVKNPTKKVGELLGEVAGKMGEKIVVNRFVRFALGENE